MIMMIIVIVVVVIVNDENIKSSCTSNYKPVDGNFIKSEKWECFLIMAGSLVILSSSLRSRPEARDKTSCNYRKGVTRRRKKKKR